MLLIQRASAGSGKTYTLTQKFIQHLLCVKAKDNIWHLRTKRQIEEYLSRILAITFTNKATAEMKERIIDKLSNLSQCADAKNINKKTIASTDYLEYFHKLTGADYQSIGKAAEEALNVVLNNYSQFHISTIDSFFQEILRTFTYEANINDSYQLEIDSDYVSKSAVDTTLNEFETRKEVDASALYWLNILVEKEVKESQRWNVFTKSESGKSIYSQIRDSLKKLESEEFKTIKNELDEYFLLPDAEVHFRHFYEWLKEEGPKEKENQLKELKGAAEDILETIDRLRIKPEVIQSNFQKLVNKVLNLKVDSKIKEFKILSHPENLKVYKATKGEKPEELNEVANMMVSKLKDFFNPESTPVYTAWKVFGSLMPYFGLIIEVSKRMMLQLDSEHVIRLSDTNYLLKKIIGNDDTSFVFERLGTHINNYLIDEFQDTSQMQWDVINPLLSSSLGEDEESLIIGDPKQSIYRFRNADHRLIMTEVPNAYPRHEELGMSIEENTNWRSKRNIVEFNNYFFRTLAMRLSKKAKGELKENGIRDLYSNVVQYPHSRDKNGYVEIRFYDKDLVAQQPPSDLPVLEGLEEEDSVDVDYDTWALYSIGPLISELLERGYRQNDIGILVNTNTRGKNVIESLIAYNATIDAGKKIEFLSEESLLLSQSPAVDLILNILEKIADSGFVFKTREEDEEDKKYHRIPWHRIKANYFFYSMIHPEMRVEERVLKFLEEDISEDYLRSLINELQTPTLTAIIENVIDNFIDDGMRKSEAIYISAFQDVINEYSSGFSDDPASFLEWWEARGKKLAVSSPEGTDAVQIMTIHKSKGLEFKVVIIPFATDSFEPSEKKKEWRWVRPYFTSEDIQIPPFLPISTEKSLEGTAYGKVYNSYFDQVMTDKLNMYYVAFTRAVNELYIFTKNPKREKINLQSELNHITGHVEELLQNYTEEEKSMMISEEDVIKNEENLIVTIGEKLSSVEIGELYERENKKSKNRTEIVTIDEYKVNDKRPQLRFIASESSDFA